METIITFILWLLRREKFEITREGLPRYLTRWTLWGGRFKDGHKVFLHLFHRGDAEPYAHDHPWPFWSLILWGGYWELTPVTDPTKIEELSNCHHDYVGQAPDKMGDYLKPPFEKIVWYKPLSLLKRPANWQHRVLLPSGRRCWTLVWCGPKERSWGYICPGRGWIPWRQHEANQSAGHTGCFDGDN